MLPSLESVGLPPNLEQEEKKRWLLEQQRKRSGGSSRPRPRKRVFLKIKQLERASHPP
jgi:hypothetical protein